MRAFYTVLLMSSCLFYGCLETDDFEVAEENPTTIILTNPNDPLPNEDRFHHSELGATKDHEYENNYYGDLLIMNHDYNYFGDGVNFTYGYSLEAGLIFSGTFLGRSNSSEVWHLVSDN